MINLIEPIYYNSDNRKYQLLLNKVSISVYFYSIEIITKSINNVDISK